MRTLLIIAVAALAGCSSGLQEVAFMDQGRYVVSRSLVNDRVTANQPHPSGTFICRSKISSEDMAELRKDGNVHSAYSDCAIATEYVQSSDQPIATLYKGFGEAAALGIPVGVGLALSGDEITASGGNASAKAKAKAQSGKKRR